MCGASVCVVFLSHKSGSMVKIRAYAAAVVLSLSASADAFAPVSISGALPRGRPARRQAARGGALTHLSAVAPYADDTKEGGTQTAQRKAFVTPVVEDIPWRAQSPYRNDDAKTIAYLNQFPNTWQPAERIAQDRSQDLGKAKDYVSTSGIRLQTADTLKVYDAAVVGTGPAGVAIALNLARQGMSVTMIGPIGGAWPNNYGVWLDEWDELGLPDMCLEQTYESTRITISGDESIGIPRAYGKVNGNKCREWMLEQCAELGVHVLEGIVCDKSTGKGKEKSTMTLTNGQSISCRVPIVAAGHYSPLVKYQSPGVEFMRMQGEYMTRDWQQLMQIPSDERIVITKKAPTGTLVRDNDGNVIDNYRFSEHVESGPLSQLSWKHSVQFDSVRPGQHAWGWNWGWNVILRGLKVPEWIPFFGGCEAIGGGAPGYQIAYGITVECENEHGFPLNEMLLMDFSTEHLVGDSALEGGVEGHIPTFLYAFPYDKNTVFLQETHLVARNHRAQCKSLEMEEMVRRLERRIDTLGLKVKKRYDEECSVIPMGGPLPVLGQPTVAYGAAAIMVHPASGYMINRVILQAPEVAAAIASTLRDTDCPKLAAEAGWEAIWPKHRLIERDLYCFGMEVLLDLDLALLRDFFGAFFADPRDKMWREFLAWRMTNPGDKPYKMSVFMILQFFRGSPRLKGRLIRDAMFKDGLHLLKSIFELPFPFD